MVVRRIRLDPADARDARFIEVNPGRHFTTLTLDRDNHVYRAHAENRPDDAALHPGVAAAVEGYMDAVADYLWVHVGNGTFGNSLGPSFVELPAPFHLTDQLLEALRNAELDHDTAGLRTLTATLRAAVPLEEWLAPGERQLRQGIDFGVPPSAFLELLRARARSRGLRLNGRAEPGAVWVRPTMGRANQALRRDHPERFGHFADPAPYAEHVAGAQAAARPPLAEPHRPAPPVPDPPRFLRSALALPDPWSCPCGHRGPLDSPGHAKAHLDWAVGFPIPKNVPWPAEIAVVTATSPVSLRRVAHQCAMLPRRENHYDFASFDVGDGTPEDSNNRAYLYAHQGRVVGFCSVFDTTHARWHPFDSSPATAPSSAPAAPETVPHSGDGMVRPAVNVVFTADSWRRHGIGQVLGQTIAADAGIDPADLAWSQPFTPAGQGLARSIDPTGAWLA